MKKIMMNLTVVLGVLFCASAVCEAQTLSDLSKYFGGTQKQDTTATEQKTDNEVMSQLSKLMGGGTQKQDTTATEQKSSTTTGSATGSALSGLMNAIGGKTSASGESSGNSTASLLEDILGSVIAANTELTVESLVGTWNYEAPACKFVSEDFLKSAGGELAASKINEQLAPLYAKVGVTNGSLGFTFEESGDFVMNYGILPITGTATKAEEKGIFTLEFVKLGTTAIATTPVRFEVVGDKMIMLFEADKLVNMLRSIVTKLGITSLNAIFELVDSYDGVLIGFELVKQA